MSKSNKNNFKSEVINIKLDYSIESPEERNKICHEICAKTPLSELTPKVLEQLADYIIFAMDKAERRSRAIMTPNRLVTINKRETSYQNLVSKLETGEDGLWNLMTSGDDHGIILSPKISITPEDIEEIPNMRELRDSIAATEQKIKSAMGRERYILKRQLIEMRQQQYVLKQAFRQPMRCQNYVKSINNIKLPDSITIVSPDDDVRNDGILSLFNSKHVSALLCNYDALKRCCHAAFNTDLYYLMQDLDTLIEQTIKAEPIYYTIFELKAAGYQNTEIQAELQARHDTSYSIEYISNLWRNKIPKLIAEKAKDNYLIWYFSKRGPATPIEKCRRWKRCTRCGQVKLASPRFFSKNNSSKDHLYSICKECRKKKRTEKS